MASTTASTPSSAQGRSAGLRSLADPASTLARLEGLEAHALAVEIASLPERIRGFGYIKEKNVAEVRQKERELLESWRLSGSRAKAA